MFIKLILAGNIGHADRVRSCSSWRSLPETVPTNSKDTCHCCSTVALRERDQSYKILCVSSLPRIFFFVHLREKTYHIPAMWLWMLHYFSFLNVAQVQTQGDVTHIFCLAAEKVETTEHYIKLWWPSFLLCPPQQSFGGRWIESSYWRGGWNNCRSWLLGLKAHAVLPPPIQSMTQPLSSHNLSSDKST